MSHIVSYLIFIQFFLAISNTIPLTSGIRGKPWRLIKEIYRNVKNKVVFNDYESDYFDQEYAWC